MRKNYYIFMVFYFLFIEFTVGQVGVNTTEPKATLHIEATDSENPLQTDGLILPKIATFPSTNPTSNQLGMLVYLTNDLSNFIVDATAKNYSSGFYFWDPSQTDWIPFILNNTWKLDGNDNTLSGTNFIGTTNGEEVDFRVNNQIVSRLTELGQLELMAKDRSVFIGFEAGENYVASSSAEQDTFIGYRAGTNTTTGRDNTALGAFALRNNVIGSFNTAIGDESLLLNENGLRNTGLGGATLRNNVSGNGNTAIGFSALRNNTSGDSNTAIGNEALRDGNGYSNSTALGNRAGINSSGDNTTSIGAFSLENGGTGINNTAIGVYALRAATNGNNVAVGANAGDNVTTGTNNVFIGTNTNATVGTVSNATSLGDNASVGADHTVAIGANSRATAPDAIAIGDDARADDSWAIAIGEFANANAEDAVAIGHRSTVVGFRGASLGLNADIGPGGNQAIAIGVNSNALHDRSIAFGSGAVTTADNQFKISPTISTIDASSAVITAESYIATVGSGTGYADYVFDIYYDGRSDLTTSYKFPTLEEAEQFVKINGHLIGVKSIEDIEDQGMTVNVTEVSLKNLEKLEEQFLYITELNSRLKRTETLLKIHDEQLKRVIKTLEKLNK